MKVLFLPRVRRYFDELEIILYEKEYFSYEESAHEYADKLVYDIKTNLHKHLHKPAPTYFNKYGKSLFYAAFRKNKQTTWYVFFTKYQYNNDTVFLVRYISNNHSVAQYL